MTSSRHEFGRQSVESVLGILTLVLLLGSGCTAALCYLVMLGREAEPQSRSATWSQGKRQGWVCTLQLVTSLFSTHDGFLETPLHCKSKSSCPPSHWRVSGGWGGRLGWEPFAAQPGITNPISHFALSLCNLRVKQSLLNWVKFSD